ncbi:DUF4172 domain-containing protein [Nocardia africana]|uniref:DUF4172 domain-containing protein n=1 Tax=Nocardia africana TaxID=134964 RepID=A0ABW6NVY5_9NOCA
MTSPQRRYIWQRSDWPTLTYDVARLAGPLAQVAHRQGYLLGRLAVLTTDVGNGVAS